MNGLNATKLIHWYIMDKSLCMLNNDIFVLSCYGQVVEDTTLFLGEIVVSLLVEDRVHGCNGCSMAVIRTLVKVFLFPKCNKHLTWHHLMFSLAKV